MSFLGGGGGGAEKISGRDNIDWKELYQQSDRANLQTYYDLDKKGHLVFLSFSLIVAYSI